jgi:hypothetical protein
MATRRGPWRSAGNRSVIERRRGLVALNASAIWVPEQELRKLVELRPSGGEVAARVIEM